MSKLAVIAGATVVVSVALVWSARAFGADGIRFAFAVVWIPMVAVGTTSRLVPIRLPSRFHALRRFERSGRVHEMLGVRVAKRLLRRGPLAVFNPGLHIPAEPTPSGLERLERRMRDAEASHTVLFVATLAVVVHALARGWWIAAAGTLAFDIVMNGYPAMLQRYNRAKLAERFASGRV